MITITWGNEDKSILLYQFEGSWTINDLTEALDAGFEVAARYDHDIDVVVDLSQSGIPNLLGTNVRQAFQQTMAHSNEQAQQHAKEPGIVAIVTNNPIIRGSLTSTLPLYRHMADSEITVHSTLDTALNAVNNFRLSKFGEKTA